MQIVIITGLSGAGKSYVLRSLEDAGFYCVDNIPPALITKFAEMCIKTGGKIQNAALVTDLRGGEMFKDLTGALNELKNAGFNYKILFLDCSDEVLVKRYKETRRVHPLALEGSIVDGIGMERDILKDIKEKADYVIDTTNLKPADLKSEIIDIFTGVIKKNPMMVNVMSFGFKYGLPIDSDLVFDVRFLPNPFYITDLKQLSGLDEPVRDYVMENNLTIEYIKRLKDFIAFLLPHYVEEGKNSLVISVGCTGGRHRSVAIAQDLGQFVDSLGYHVLTMHRDIKKVYL